VEARGRSRFRHVGRAILATLSIGLAWWVFDLLGRGLMRLPSSVHEGTVWEEIVPE
jgi:hypothetical protein